MIKFYRVFINNYMFIMVSNSKLGEEGEHLACNYLEKHKYRILERNWRYKHKEIDIIAFKDNEICIVEVKTRSSDYIAPKESVTIKKQENLIHATSEYIKQNNIDYDIRFDVVEVILNSKQKKITHIKDAFTPQIN